MPVSPIGGGIDGPLYADYQDVTDNSQIAGAGVSVREKLNVLPDSLVLDFAEFAGDIRSNAPKADAPVINQYIKLRTTGPLETTQESPEDFEAEFMSLIELLSPKLRVLLLRNMQLAKGERNPELDGLEESLKQQVGLRMWARKILSRFRDKGGEDEEEEKERRGIFTLEEEEDLLPDGIVIPETRYVPINKIDPVNMTSEQVTKQIQANCVFVLEYQLGILRMQLDSLPFDDPVRPILNGFPKIIARMIKHSKAFVNLRGVLSFEKAQKAAVGLNKINLSLIDEQRQALEKAGLYSVRGPSGSMVAFATSVLETAVICCGILRSDATVTALHIEGAALLHLLLLRSTTLIGYEAMALLSRMGTALSGMGLQANKVKTLQVAWLLIIMVTLLLPTEEALPYLVAYKPNVAEGLAESQKGDEDEETVKQNLQDVARTIAVQLAMATITASRITDTIVTSLIKIESKIVPEVFRFLTLTAIILTGRGLLEKVGGSGEAFFGQLTFNTLGESAHALQKMVDEKSTSLAMTTTLQGLTLGELPFQGDNLLQQMIIREKPLENLGLHLREINIASEQIRQLTATLGYSMMELWREHQQVVPGMNVII